jgi:NAD(P)-dependent dehydrogenase (short-subunit alcohol dehydrogenase family)
MSINKEYFNNLAQAEKSVLGVFGKTAVITGASRGIGKSTALLLSSLGVKVGIIDITQDGESVAEEIRKTGGKAIFIEGDVTDSDQIERCMSKVAEEFGGIDFLVNNAGISDQVPFEDLEIELWNKIISVNLTGAYICTKAALKYLKQKESSCIVMLSSGSVFTGTGGCPAYVAAKGGIVSLIRALARELSVYNIRVNAVAPRSVRTEMLESVFSKEEIARKEEHIPLQRLGSVENVADVVLFLLSEMSDYITGETLLIDGGRTFLG